MSEHVTGNHIKQTVLFPDMLDDYIDKENPVRFIDAFVESLKMEKLCFKHSTPSDTGRPQRKPLGLFKAHLVRSKAHSKWQNAC
jgi:transposase